MHVIHVWFATLFVHHELVLHTRPPLHFIYLSRRCACYKRIKLYDAIHDGNFSCVSLVLVAPISRLEMKEMMQRLEHAVDVKKMFRRLQKGGWESN